jgi:hypothetical protein
VIRDPDSLILFGKICLHVKSIENIGLNFDVKFFKTFEIVHVNIPIKNLDLMALARGGLITILVYMTIFSYADYKYAKIKKISLHKISS